MQLDLSGLQPVNSTKVTKPKRTRKVKPEDSKLLEGTKKKTSDKLGMTSKEQYNWAGIQITNGKDSNGASVYLKNGSEEDFMYTINYLFGKVLHKQTNFLIGSNKTAEYHMKLLKKDWQGPDELFKLFVAYNLTKTVLFKHLEQKMNDRFYKRLSEYNSKNNTNIKVSVQTGKLIDSIFAKK